MNPTTDLVADDLCLTCGEDHEDCTCPRPEPLPDDDPNDDEEFIDDGTWGLEDDDEEDWVWTK